MVDFFNWFTPFDTAILTFVNVLQQSAGGFLTPLAKVVTFLGEYGILYFLIAIILALFKKTRKTAVCIFGAVCCGALITNVILKDAICRLRPFEENEVFYEFFKAVNVSNESGYSFPSGHTTAVTAFAVALFLTCNKKYSWLGFLGVILMGFSRVYLICHYPTDVIAGILVGFISALISYAITILIFNLLNKYKKIRAFEFMLEFDVGYNVKGKSLEN